MRKVITYCIRGGFTILMLTTFCFCETNGPEDYKKYFIKYYGGDGNQEAKDFVINPDGTIIMLGTYFESNGNTRVYLVKTDGEGQVIWSRKLGTTAEYAQDIEPIVAGPDAGNFVILSNVKKNAEDSLAIRLTIISSEEGDSLKSKYFDALASQQGYSVTPNLAGGYLVGGKTTAPQSEDTNSDFVNIEDQLIIQFEPDFSYTDSDVRRIGGSAIGAVVKIFDNGSNYYYAGYSDEKNALVTDATYESNFFFRSFDAVGTVRQTGYAGSQDENVNEYMSSIIKYQTLYLAVGTRVSPSGMSNLFAARLNSNFTVATEALYTSKNVEGISADVSLSSEFLFLGNEIMAGGNRNIWFTRVNSLDELNSGRTITFGAPNNDDTASAIKELPNGDILILGTMELVNQKKMALIKIKSNGSF